MTVKDIIVEDLHNGLYVKKRENGTYGLTNKFYATHFTSKREAKRAVRAFGSVGFKFTDLNKKGKSNEKSPS